MEAQEKEEIEVTKWEVERLRRKLEEKGLRTENAKLVAKLQKFDRMITPGGMAALQGFLSMDLYKKSKKSLPHQKALGKTYTEFKDFRTKDMMRVLTEQGYSEAEENLIKALAKRYVGERLTSKEGKIILACISKMATEELCLRGPQKIAFLKTTKEQLGISDKERQKKLSKEELARIREEKERRLEKKFAKVKPKTIKRKRSRRKT